MKTELLKKWNVAIVAGCLAMGVSNAQTITNGSMTGPEGLATVPSGWEVHAGTADTYSSHGFSAFTPTSSPIDGGTWVGMLQSEAIRTTVTDLVIGQEYTIAWEQAAFGSSIGGITNDSDARFNFRLNGVITYTTSPIVGADSTWYTDSFTFTAVSESTVLRITQINANTYGQVDGFTITASGVPEPSSTALLGLSALGLLVRRKR